MSKRLELVLNTLKSRVEQNQTIVQLLNGECAEVSFYWEEPASVKEIEEVNQKIGWSIPEEYKSFLLMHNGASLFINDGGTMRLYPLNEIVDYYNESQENNYGHPAHWYLIGVYHGVAEYLYIDSERVKQGRKDYLIFESIGDFTRLKCDFEEWLDRLIVCQGEQFWLWE
ncbi:SMI1/KNR4 family protein [Brevibacillus panacihumi]|uniref:SMI1/KNR4 family protein n=1 Tax=Brevibacillus panacihumi TaxID=497735 RepID=UPI003CFDFA52